MSITIAKLSAHPLQLRRSGFDFLRALLLFVVGASVAVDVPVMGRVMGPDVLCTLGLLVFLLMEGVRNFRKDAMLFFAMLGLWLVGAILTDVIRETPTEDIVRGWGKIIFFGITFAYLYLATKRKLFLVSLFLLGLNVGALMRVLVDPDIPFLAEPWKFGYGSPITILVMACISTPLFLKVAGSWGQITAIILLAILNLVENSRAVFAILLTVAAIVAFGWFLRLLLQDRPMPKLLFLLTLLGGGIFYKAVVSIYEMAASSGMLGLEALQKFQLQTQSGLGVLLGGRPEWLISLQAIIDSPIIGHGSWAKDFYYVLLYLRAREDIGAAIFGDPLHSALIPSHSFLFGSWVEAGIVGGLFWIYILAICGRSLYSLFHIPLWSRPLVTFVVISLIWDVLFSPFAAEQRFIVPAELCMAFWAIGHERWRTSLRQQTAGAAT